ncbi:MAG: heat-inducible transcriptional repressor HrcA [Paeniglutamicibacter terrestris]|jgi:heat-inducible transcriptional repressor|uniref:Heat-inducible transcription repressor HrcA n=1 Tax=Paeniglutamicibacter terrestris TaxID=2723403 RepID=A0ABX1G5N7_9MICC|nr:MULTISPECIES: heat-inducible transcriptional repressor HrcA [Paeniglutamicibacter]ASN39309.1 heat-inducible transcriptional repressor HrcA [Arthrobacter sp. 7749]NKG20891.1 heat-inducible transcriptional repressor HrcA [Paeniglutamicibacter terrestris]QXQ11907.1 heat-inducible transcriptional repressor HrcA [Paeniglutamicibacter sp. Y32M11]
MTEPRRLEVLRAIVEDYVQSREPVGSRALLERHDLGVSAATIRNDMASLEEEGLIVAPHTSSGRIPTEKGYRHFVDQIGDVKPLSGPERRAIAALLEGSHDVNDVLENTVRLLASITRQVALIQVPHYSNATVRHIELVGLGAGQTLVVLIASSGKVEQRVILLPRTVGEDDLARLRSILLTVLASKPIAEVARLGQGAIDLVEPRLVVAVRIITEVLGSLARNSSVDRILTAGTANLSRSNMDFPLSITPVLEALEEQVVLLRLFSELEQDAHGIAVGIGTENQYGALTEASVVATGYGPGEQAMIGVLGPTRMNYPTSMAAVRAVSRYLSRILAG